MLSLRGALRTTAAAAEADADADADVRACTDSTTPPGCPDVTPTGDAILNVNDVLFLLDFIINGGDASDPCVFESLDYNSSGVSEHRKPK